ncbi:hypothetical protein T492DRAFT_1148949 [Pavlovales sp. CCMP2436]|nr:hypothetical protein T492DRAFT_1148949 [Pavlovales sp. CCMP2436]
MARGGENDTQVLTTSDAKEHRIVLPKPRCEAVLVDENKAAHSSAGRDCILRIWLGSDAVTDPDEGMAVLPAAAQPVVVVATAVPVALAAAAGEPAPAGTPAGAPGSAGEEEPLPEPTPTPMVPVKVHVPTQFYNFRYRISPCGKSFIHTIQDQQNVLASLGICEGDRLTLCRWKIDKRLAILVSRASQRPQIDGTCSTVVPMPAHRQSKPAVMAKQTNSSPSHTIAHRKQKRKSLAPVAFAPNGLPPVGADGIIWPERSPPPKRALTLFPDAAIRVGSAFQAAVPDSPDWVEDGPAAYAPTSPGPPTGAAAAVPQFTTWPDSEHERFSLALSSHGKNMRDIAGALGMSTKAAVEYYYYRKSHAVVSGGPVPSWVTDPLPFP